MSAVPVCGQSDFGSPNISASPSTVNPGDEITVTYSGAPGFDSDWIAIYEVGDPNEWYGELYYLYGENSHSGPSSQIAHNYGIQSFLGMKDHYMRNKEHIAATNHLYQINDPGSPGNTLIGNYCPFSGGVRNRNEKSGSLIFTAPDEPGDYEFQLFENDGFDDIARSNVVTVQEGTTVPTPTPTPTPSGFTFYGVYDRLVDTDSLNASISHAVMSGDGQKLFFTGENVATGDVVAYTVNADGSNLRSVRLPDIIGVIVEVAINRDGSRAFFRDRGYHLLYKVEGGVATQILDAHDYPEINKLWGGPETTADGEYVYFAEDRDDLWRVRHSGGAPEKVIEDTEVPRQDSKGEKAWAVQNFALSADASTIVFGLVGYHDPTSYGYHAIKEELFVRDSGGYRQLTNDTSNVGKSYLDISGDGTTIAFSAGTPQSKWYSIRSDGTGKIALEDLCFNVGGVSLNYDGTKMFYEDSGAHGGRLVDTDGSGDFDLFPAWNVINIAIGATWDLCLSDDGSRVSFRFGYSSWPFKQALYVGHLNNPSAVPDAPTIESINFDPPSMPTGDPDARVILTSEISDPQSLADIERTSTDELLDGRLEYGPDCPAYFPYAAHDDGSSPDQTDGDGVFSTKGQPGGKIDELDRITVRMGAMDASKTVVVADTILPIGVTIN